MRDYIGGILKSPKFWKGVGSVILAILVYSFMPADVSESVRRMSFIFTVAAFFWALEVVPLYTTSLLIVLMEVLFLCQPGGAESISYKVFLVPFGSPIIMLFFGGLMIAVALGKYHIDVMVVRRLMKLFGKKPYFIMLGFMVTAAFLSMWMSNTATTAMMIAMVLPLLKQVPKESPFRTALVLAVPFGANIGGIATPVGTPPNAIAIGILSNMGINLSFVGWMKMAFPLAVLLLAIGSVILYFMFPSTSEEIDLHIEVKKKFNHITGLVSLIVIGTIGLWLTSSFHHLPSAVVALLAVGALYLFHLLDKSDLKRVDWDVLVLMWGGLALGKGLEVSGLTDWIVTLPIFQQEGVLLVVVFAFLSLAIASFMSHTATANLVIPIVMAIPGENNVLLAVTVALACSFAMAFPISTPPNAIAFATDMVKTKDMIKAGALISVISLIIMLLGYQLII